MKGKEEGKNGRKREVLTMFLVGNIALHFQKLPPNNIYNIKLYTLF